VFGNGLRLFLCGAKISTGGAHSNRSSTPARHGLISRERPVLIVKGFSTTHFWGLLLTTKLKPNNRCNHAFKHDGMGYDAIISQLRVYDAKRLIRKLYALE
jgi:hypothetical protein